MNIPVMKPSIGPEEEQAVLAVLRSGWLAQGPKVAEFEKNFAAYVGAKQAVAVSSCTTALHLSLAALGVGPGDEVICPSYTFIATGNVIRHCGAEPVFVDIDPGTYNINPRLIEQVITPKTKAIMPVHQVGLPAALDSILEISRRRGLPVVEDAACAAGAACKGKKIGAPHGLLCCFSFHPRKVLTTGEGGMVTTNDESLAERIRSLRNHAMSLSAFERHAAGDIRFEEYPEVAYNFRMSDVTAAIGIEQLRKLDAMVARRVELASRYSDAFSAQRWLAPPHVPSGLNHTFQSYLLRLRPGAPLSRNALMKSLLDKGISTRRGIMAIHREQPYRSDRWSLPETDQAVDSTLILPLYHTLTADEQDFVIQNVCRLLER